MNTPGGYQTINLSSLTLGTQAVTVTMPNVAEILRTTRKPVYFYGAKFGANTVRGWVTIVGDTGAKDGKVYNIVGTDVSFNVTTDDDNVTFTPVA